MSLLVYEQIQVQSLQGPPPLPEELRPEATTVDRWKPVAPDVIFRPRPLVQDFFFLPLADIGCTPLTVNALTSGEDTDGGATATTASITPGANRLVLLAIHTVGAGGAPVITGNGLTWELVTSVDSGGGQRLYLFRAMGGSPSAGAVSIDFGGNNQIALRWSICEFLDADTSGSNGSGAVVQSNTAGPTNGTSLTVNLSAFADPRNAAFGAFASSGGNPDGGAGFTEIHDIEQTLTEWALNDTSVDITSTFSQLLGIAIEVRSACAPAPADAPEMSWYIPTNQPFPALRYPVREGLFVTDPTIPAPAPPEVITLDKWYRPASEPVRGPRWPVAQGVQWFDLTDVVPPPPPDGAQIIGGRPLALDSGLPFVIEPGPGVRQVFD